MRMLPECEKEKRKYFRFFKPRQSPAVSLFSLKTRSNNRSRAFVAVCGEISRRVTELMRVRYRCA